MKEYVFLPLVLTLTILTNPVMGWDQLDEDLKFACQASRSLMKGGGEERWCRCMTHYFEGALSDAEKKHFTMDYFSSMRDENGGMDSVEVPSRKYYGREYSPRGYCSLCYENDYEDCESEKPKEVSYTQWWNKIRDGKAIQSNKKLDYHRFFYDFVAGYSTYCSDNLKSYIERTITTREDQQIGGIWWPGQETSYTTRVEDKELLGAFINSENTVEFALMTSTVQAIVGSRKERSMLSKMLTDLVSFELHSKNFMQEKLDKRCDSDEVKQTYENLKRFSSGRELVASNKYKQVSIPVITTPPEKRKEILKAAKRSYKKHRSIIEAKAIKRASLAEILRGPVLNCNVQSISSSYNSIKPSPPGRRNSGLWEGQIYGHNVEIFTMMASLSGISGYGYITDHDCIFELRGMHFNETKYKFFSNFSSDFKYPEKFPNCRSLFTTEQANLIGNNDDFSFEFGGMIKFENGEADSFNFYTNYLRLGEGVQNASCDNNSFHRVFKRKDKISSSFSKRLKDHNVSKHARKKQFLQFYAPEANSN